MQKHLFAKPAFSSNTLQNNTPIQTLTIWKQRPLYNCTTPFSILTITIKNILAEVMPFSLTHIFTVFLSNSDPWWLAFNTEIEVCSGHSPVWCYHSTFLLVDQWAIFSSSIPAQIQVRYETSYRYKMSVGPHASWVPRLVAYSNSNSITQHLPEFIHSLTSPDQTNLILTAVPLDFLLDHLD